MKNIILRELKEMARVSGIPIRKTYRKADYIRELGLENTHSSRKLSGNPTKVKLVNKENGEIKKFSMHERRRTLC